MRSYQTTLAGVLLGLGALCNELGSNISTMEEINITIILQSLGLILIGWFARDNNKSSETVRIK